MNRTTRIRNASLGGIVLSALIATSASAQVMPMLIQRQDNSISQQPRVEDVANTPPGGFSAEINGTQSFSYDSNPLRTNTGEKAIWGSTTSPELVLRQKTPTSIVESTSRIDANIYNRSEFDSVDLHQDLLMGRNNERWDTEVLATFDRDTTRESEIANYGSTNARVYSNRIGAAPKVTFKQNERDSWILAGSALHASYSDNSYTDFNFYTLSPTFQHAFDDKNAGRISVNGQRYETDSGPSSASNSIGPSIGWTNKATPRLTLHADAGAAVTSKEGLNSNIDDGKWDYVFSGGISYKDRVDSFDVTASRAQQPFGNGTEALVDALTGKALHNISETIAINGNATYRKADYASVQPGINLDNEYSIGTGLSYKVMKQVALTADYTYHNENLTNQTGTMNEHIVMLGINFHPSWSGK